MLRELLDAAHLLETLDGKGDRSSSRMVETMLFDPFWMEHEAPTFPHPAHGRAI